MYEIYANNTLIFSDVTPLDSYKIISAILSLEDNAAGSLEFTLPPENVGYNSISCLTTECIVKRDNVEIWRGRVISEDMNFWRQKHYVCEGELAYLVDTIQPPKAYNASAETNPTTIDSFLRSLIAEHNAQVKNTVGIDKIFTVGNCSVVDGDNVDDDNKINRFTNYETTLECINDKLLNRLGGHIRIRHSGSTRYIDYLKEEDDALNDVSEQEIRFGVNLLDYAQNADATQWVTAIIPRGKRLEKEEIAGLEAYTTAKTSAIVDDWHVKNSMVVKHPTRVNNFGFICAVVDWDDVTKPDNLVKKAKKYLKASQFEKLTLEVSVADLHYLNASTDVFDLLDKVHCVSDPHGMDALFPVTKMSIDLLNPSNTIYTLGTDIRTSLTSASNKIDNSIKEYIDNTPNESAVLTNAKLNATSLIEGSAIGGYASFIYGWQDKDKYGNTNNAIIDQKIDPETGKGINPIGLRVANKMDDNSATSRWLWTTGGLGHYKKDTNKNSKTYMKWLPVNVALTMDGAIVADRITTGTLTLAGNGSTSTLVVYNKSTKIGSWGANGISILAGSIKISDPDDKDDDGNPKVKFRVTTKGLLTAVDGKFSGTITATTITSSTISGSKITTQTNSKGSGCYMVAEGGMMTIYDSKDEYLKIKEKDDTYNFLTLGTNEMSCRRRDEGNVQVDTYKIFELFDWWDKKAYKQRESIVNVAKYYSEHGGWN